MMTDKISTQDPFYAEKLEELSKGLDLDQAYTDFSTAKDQQASGTGLQFTTYPIPGNLMTPDLRVDAAIDGSGGVLVKLVYHVQGCSQKAAEVIGEKIQGFCMATLHPLAGDVCGQFSENPMFRGNWDLLVWGVPALRAKEIHRMAIETITGTFGGQ